ncbi:MAG: DNA-directed RNA polymerase subunit beta, partial [Candidatus Omnitrophica bacterium]|nr:DNA-directed RNA polymerase subunit beta [Candidatus Omnitrophota bacterium]
MVKRRNFAKLKDVFQLPHLLEIQFGSYEEFLQKDVPKTKRDNTGLEAVFREVFPIENYDGTYKLEYINYTLGNPKYNAQECRRRAMTYATPLKVKFRLRTPKDTREQEVYFCDLPLMTDTGTFVINGDERVVVSQLHRSPGISFEETIHPNGKRLYSSRVIPYRGAWLEFEFDLNDVMHAVLDRRRKFLATQILRAIGLSANDDILNAFKGIEKVEITKRIHFRNLIGMTLSSDVVDKEGNVIVAKDKELNKELLDLIWDKGVRAVDIIKPTVSDLAKTLQRDHTKTQQEALLDIYRKIRPGDPATIESAQVLMQRFFFDPKRYDLGKVGRFMLNRKLSMQAPLDQRILDTKTIVRVIEALVDLKNGKRTIDDIDHLGNRRIRSVGELLQNQFRIGLVRLERATRERMNIYDLENSMPHNLLNTKLIATVVKDFFGRSQLSQFMDQTNPLAEMTHKRRLSALGTGGLSRERAGFEVRDVHYTHYGRMCPIETPEGPNIGLITSLSTYARINEFGFLETPYRKADNGRVTNKIEYLTADIEDQFIVAQANAKIDKEGRFLEDRVFCRYKDDFVLSDPKEIQYMDVSPIQLVSIAAGLIPFLEHDDANRALMGSNMQRQSVPLLVTEPSLIATGLEYRTAKDSGAVVVAANSGRVTQVQSDEIVVGGKVYKLRKFEKSNANTCINQRPIVKLGQSIDEGDVIADGPATAQGELALGKDVLVAFMPWRGYNFEDAILINEKLVREDAFTSVHIEEFEMEARDTRLGNEEITRDIPNVSEEALLNLDENGIVRMGAEVSPGDILVGKVTPKSETELSP